MWSLTFGYEINDFLIRNTELNKLKPNKQKLTLSNLSIEIFLVIFVIC